MTPPLSKKDHGHLAEVMRLAIECKYEAGHSRQVTRLALRLFDELKALHQLEPRDRFLLQCAGLLHDIGWIAGQKGHHKTALKIIRKSPTLTFDKRDRWVIGAVARYHRKALPNRRHPHFARLNCFDRRIVCYLAAILRVADGLDRTHENVVKDLSCRIDPEAIIVTAEVGRPADEEIREATEKGRLMAKVFDRRLEIACHGM